MDFLDSRLLFFQGGWVIDQIGGVFGDFERYWNYKRFSLIMEYEIFHTIFVYIYDTNSIFELIRIEMVNDNTLFLRNFIGDIICKYDFDII